MRQAGHEPYMGTEQGHNRIWWGKLRERDHLKELDVDVRISKRILTE
jgi:hypothetical protein